MNSDLALLAERAVQLVPRGARLGLGTGHAAAAFLEALAQRVRQGLEVRGVPTSEASAELARRHGIPLDSLDPAEPLELTVDGADEVQRGTLYLIKGWGGALVRERIVAAASRRQVILVTAEKLVDRLGARGKLPVEVLPFAAPFCARRITALGLTPTRRPDATDPTRPFVTDNGNWILDCALQPLADPAALHAALRAIPGVLDTGLFLGTASVVLAAVDGTVHEWHPARILNEPDGG